MENYAKKVADKKNIIGTSSRSICEIISVLELWAANVFFSFSVLTRLLSPGKKGADYPGDINFFQLKPKTVIYKSMLFVAASRAQVSGPSQHVVDRIELIFETHFQQRCQRFISEKNKHTRELIVIGFNFLFFRLHNSRILQVARFNYAAFIKALKWDAWLEEWN